jgi:hypothetical protein
MSKLNLAQFRAEMIAKAQTKAAGANQADLVKAQQELLAKKQEHAEVLSIKKEVLSALQSNPLTGEIQKTKELIIQTEAQSLAVMAEIESLVEGTDPVVETVPQPTPVMSAPTVQSTPPLVVRSEAVPEGAKSTDGEQFSTGDEDQFILVIDEDSEVDVEFYINGSWESESSKLPKGYEPKWYRIAD